MSDLEKSQQHGASNDASPHSHQQWPVGPDRGAHYPFTLGASATQQAIYQGGLPLRKLANPAPLGLFSFGSSTLVLSLINVQARNVHVPNIVLGMGLFVGGLTQLLAGMWEFAAGNTLGATAFSSYGGFWMSYATILIPSSGVLAAYGDNTTELQHAIGFFLSVWFIFTFIMVIAALRSSVGLIVLFFCLMMTYMFLAIAQFVPNPHLTTAGGAFGIVTGFLAFYCGAANMLTRESSFFQLPLVPIPPGKDD